jgi:MFS family permease
METIAASKSTGTAATIAGNRTFRWLLAGSSVSMLGSHVTTIAYPLLVLRLTSSPFAAGCVAFAATAPSILVYMPAGALVDRWDPRRAMLTSEIGRGAAIAAVAVMLALGRFIMALLIAAAVIEGVLEVFSGLAERRYVGSLVGRDQASAASVRIEARTHVVLVAGRPLGGLLFGIKPIAPFLADVASFIYSVTTLIRIKDSIRIRDSRSAGEIIAPRRRLSHKGSLTNEIGQGLRWIYQDKFACRAIISFSGGTLIFQALIMVFLGDAHARKSSGIAIGMVLAASGVGGALGSAAASRVLARVRFSWIKIQTLIWCAGFALLALPAGRQFLFVAIIMAILGFTGALGNIALNTHLMRNADKEMLARVTSVGRLMTFAACAIGPVLGGVLVQELGVQGAMFFLFFLFFITPVLLLISAVILRASGRQHNSQVSQEAAVSDDSILVGQS